MVKPSDGYKTEKNHMSVENGLRCELISEKVELPS